MTDKIFISNQVKFEILKIGGLPVIKPYNLAGETKLVALKYDTDEVHYRQLEEKLQEIAADYQTGRVIYPGTVSKESTVNYCIKLVFA